MNILRHFYKMAMGEDALSIPSKDKWINAMKKRWS